MLRLLLLACLSFLFLSSSTAALLGMQQLRIVLFSVLVASLLTAAVLQTRQFSDRGRGLPLLLLVLLGWLAAIDPSFSPLDYKIILPLLAMLLAADVRQGLAGIDVIAWFWRLLAVYLLVTFGTLLFASGNVMLRGHGDMQRYDLTGSIVTHSALCVVGLVLGLVQITTSKGWQRVLAFAVVIAAAAMILLAATRTSIITIALVLAFTVIAGPKRGHLFRRAILTVVGSTLVFVIYTLVWNDAFWQRLIANEGVDYSSGRLHSLGHWLAMAAERPLTGHGVGAVRQSMADGRPIMEGGRFLEWPHNEVMRFLVEGGILGFSFIALLVTGVIANALHHARSAPPMPRALMLVVAADLLAQCLLQNYFNTIYHATLMLLLFGMVTSHYARDNASFSTRSAYAGQ